MRLVITGASSGLGAALAFAYAAPGNTLALTGRDAARLESVADACRSRGAEVVTAALDVTDRAALSTWLAAIEPVDLVIANAGISAGTGGYGESEAQARRIFAVNVDGVLNTVYPLLPGMIRRGQGQVALMSSLAAFRGMPGAPAYSASKGAVRMLGEGLRSELLPHGVAVTVICPGFIKTPMTAVNDFPMPFLMEADAAARLIRNRLEKRPAQIAFPWPLFALARLLACLPLFLSSWILAHGPKKPGQQG